MATTDRSPDAEETSDLRLSASGAQRVAFLWAVEETDRSGEVLGLDRRLEATRRSLDVGDDGDGWLERRARGLVPALGPAFPNVERLLRFTDPVAGWAPPVLLGALVVGLGSHALGPTQQVNVLAPPLLGLVVWNLAVLGLLLVRRLLPMLWPGGDGPARPVRWFEAAARRWGRRGDAGDNSGTAQVVQRYLDRWLKAASPLTAARVGRLMHSAALVMVAAVVAGMYFRGLVFEYRATWQSTFLDAGAVDAALSWLLAPASALLGVEVPSAVGLDRPPGGPAAPWIHLWAMTAALFVGLPRLLLSAMDGLRVRRLERRMTLSLPAAYVRRLRASQSTVVESVAVEPYSYRPSDRAARRLKSLVLDLAGARAQVRLAPVLAYGEVPGPFDGGLRVPLFSLAQTPEAEVHGEAVAAAAAGLADGQSLVAVVDEAPYRRKLDAADLGRLDERRRAWRRVLTGVGVIPAFLDLDRDEPAGDQDFAALEGARWPAANGGGTSK